MANFMILQPSCDIHLVLDAGFQHNGRSLNNLKLTVFEGNWLGLDNPPVRFSRNFEIKPVTDLTRISCDLYPFGQTTVTYDPGTGELRPLAVGEAFMQVRLADPIPNQPDRHHYLVARIQVHQKMNGWWFGNNSLSVFRDDRLAHSQVSIYALFDETSPGEGVVGDITGHGYIELSADTNGDIFDISNKYTDRIQGKFPGAAKLKGRLAGPMLTQDQLLDLEVIDFTDSARPIVKTHDVQLNKPAVEQHNILFLSEGFKSGEEKQFDAAVTKLAGNLRGNARHSPYNLLKDSFNIWKAFIPSKEKGVTMSPQVVASGKAKGLPIPARGTFDNSVPLQQLIIWVGLPTPKDRDAIVLDLRSKWNAANSDARLAGYQNDKVSDEAVELWKTSSSSGILQAIDSFYGLRYGLRAGERVSIVSAELLTAATPTTGGINRFVQRIHEWFIPQVTAQNFDLDWRRYAPELFFIAIIPNGDIELAKPAFGSLTLDHIRQLRVAGTNDDLGRLWQREFTPDPAVAGRQVGSVGLVCILANDGHKAGSNMNFRTFAAISLDSKQTIDVPDDDSPDPKVRRLNRDVNQDLPFDPEAKNMNVSAASDFLAHEFGHSFILGDEYESPPAVNKASAELSDNLTFYGTIAVQTPANQTPRIDPDKVKWLKLHRTAKSDGIVKPVEKISGTQVKVTLQPGRLSRWSDGEDVFLRKYKGDSDFSRGQLPIDPADDIVELKITGAPNTADNTLTLTGSHLPALVTDFRAGSVLFVPVRFKADPITSAPVKLSDTELKVVLQTGKAPRWQKGEKVFLHGVASDEVLELKVAELNEAENSVRLATIHFGVELPQLGGFQDGSIISSSKQYKDNSPKLLSEREVIDHLKNSQEPLTNNFNASVSDKCEPPDPKDPQGTKPDDPPSISGIKRPCKSFRLIGLYEGGSGHSCQVYRPAGGCKMRSATGDDEEGEFCFVCKYLIVNRVDPGKHEALDAQYPKPKKE